VKLRNENEELRLENVYLKTQLALEKSKIQSTEQEVEKTSAAQKQGENINRATDVNEADDVVMEDSGDTNADGLTCLLNAYDDD